MAKNSNIQWTDHSWNVARGCSKVDEDCKYCYMYRDSLKATRYDPKQVVRTKTVFDLPLRIIEPSKIFTSSLTDLFHPAIDPYRNEVWSIIRRCPHHIFQVLTKRIERAPECLPEDWGAGYKNVWLGTSIGNNKSIDRLWRLLDTPARIRFVSFEPLHERISYLDLEDLSGLHWAIIGGESGNDTGQYRYRPCKIEWIEELMCDLFPRPVFIKQLGTYLSKKLGLKHRHGADMNEWPEHLRIREFPTYQSINL